MNEDYIQ